MGKKQKVQNELIDTIELIRRFVENRGGEFSLRRYQHKFPIQNTNELTIILQRTQWLWEIHLTTDAMSDDFIDFKCRHHDIIKCLIRAIEILT